MDPTQSLVVFARAPEVGRVKTRLASELGAETALAAYREMAELIIAAVQSSRSYSVTVSYTPENSEPLMREWLGPSVTLRAQVTGTLGERMAAAIADELSRGVQHVAVIGTDCPDVSAAVILDAFERLASADVVLGPATDGGYYLLAMSRLHASLFADVPWSAADTLRVTCERAHALGLSVAMLDERRDIDTADDWRDWLARRAAAAAPVRVVAKDSWRSRFLE